MTEVAARARVRPPVRRRTRIVATIGPASDSPATLQAMEAAGMDVARVTLAHGSVEEAITRIRTIRDAVPEVGVLIDLPGPKVRTMPFPGDGVVLGTGEEVRITANRDAVESSASMIGIDIDEGSVAFAVGDRIALGDGGVSLEVESTEAGVGLARVRSGGPLRGRPGVTLPERGVALVTPTQADLYALKMLVAEGVDMVACSFVRSAADIEVVRAAIDGEPVLLMAKIETRDAIDTLDSILQVSDAVMVARGDLGVRLPLEEIPHLQKAIIRAGVRFGRPVITATQMLESMVTALTPTRAEVTDVANAVLDGTSAVMLSGETAVGVDPANVVATMARIVERTEADFDYLHWGENLGVQEVSGDASSAGRITAAITGAAWRAAVEEDAAAIIACTRTGATARAISRFRPLMPILAATPSSLTAHQLKLSWGVESMLVRMSRSTDDIVWFAVKAAVEAGYAMPGDVVVVLAGSPDESDPVCDTLRLVRVR